MTRIQKLKDKLNLLNDHINGLKEWDDYAQDCQIAYDRLLQDYNKLLEESNDENN